MSNKPPGTGLSYISLYVSDLTRALPFYRDGLGLELLTLSQDSDNPLTQVAFFDLAGVRLALYPALAQCAGTASGCAADWPPKVSLSFNVAHREEVDKLLQRLSLHGGHISKAAALQPWGSYGGFIQDCDGHLWEIVWSPSRHPES